MKSDDLAALIASQGGSGVDLHVGLVKSWSADAGTNTVEVLGTDIHDVPVLTAAGIVSLQPGTSVVIMRYKNTYFIIGQVVGVDSNLAQPQFPVVMYPQFQPNLPIDTIGFHNVSAGSLAGWQGRLMPSHPRVEVDGVWGRASGTGSTTYQLKVNSEVAGEWTVDAGFTESRQGPFDIARFVGTDWLRIEVVISASPGTGQKYLHVHGVYLRQAE